MNRVSWFIAYEIVILCILANNILKSYLPTMTKTKSKRRLIYQDTLLRGLHKISSKLTRDGFNPTDLELSVNMRKNNQKLLSFLLLRQLLYIQYYNH